jgi:hypothetical protein
MGAACLSTIGFAAAPSILDARVLIATAMLSGALLLGAMVIALVSRWRKQQAHVIQSTHEQLASFRAAHERGELSREEFDRIKERLTRPLRPLPKNVAPKAPTSAVAPAAPTDREQPRAEADPTPPASDS